MDTRASLEKRKSKIKEKKKQIRTLSKQQEKCRIRHHAPEARSGVIERTDISIGLLHVDVSVGCGLWLLVFGKEAATDPHPTIRAAHTPTIPPTSPPIDQFAHPPAKPPALHRSLAVAIESQVN